MKKAQIFVLLAVFLTSSLFSQNNAQELRFGAHTNGSLPERSEVWYRITPNQNSFMVIEVISYDFDAYVELYDASRALLGEDDDGGEGTNAKLEIYGTRGAVYLVKVRSYDRIEGGAYRIVASYKPAPRAVELRLGTSRTGNLDRGDDHWYSVRITAAGLLIVETSGDEVDTFLDAYDSVYTLIGSDDDGGIGKNARVTIMAEANQIYFFKLRSYDKLERGSYSILATFENVPEDAGNTDRSRAININIGESKSAFFHTDDESRWFSFTVPRGGANVNVYTTGSADTYMFIYDSRAFIAEDGDSGTDNNALISQRLNAGTYYIEIKECRKNLGSFSVFVTN